MSETEVVLTMSLEEAEELIAHYWASLPDQAWMATHGEHHQLHIELGQRIERLIGRAKMERP